MLKHILVAWTGTGKGWGVYDTTHDSSLRVPLELQHWSYIGTEKGYGHPVLWDFSSGSEPMALAGVPGPEGKLQTSVRNILPSFSILRAACVNSSGAGLSYVPRAPGAR